MDDRDKNVLEVIDRFEEEIRRLIDLGSIIKDSFPNCLQQHDILIRLLKSIFQLGTSMVVIDKYINSNRSSIYILNRTSSEHIMRFFLLVSYPNFYDNYKYIDSFILYSVFEEARMKFNSLISNETIHSNTNKSGWKDFLKTYCLEQEQDFEAVLRTEKEWKFETVRNNVHNIFLENNSQEFWIEASKAMKPFYTTSSSFVHGGPYSLYADIEIISKPIAYMAHSYIAIAHTYVWISLILNNDTIKEHALSLETFWEGNIRSAHASADTDTLS